MKCKICQKENKSLFTAKILRRYNVKYFYCENCGFLQTEEPYWIEEAYKYSINITDTGYVQRNIILAERLTILLLLFFFNKESKYLDYGGGYGLFVRLMRDIGFDFYWYDKYTENIFSKGFEYKNQERVKFNAITAFECIEHFIDPLQEIKKMLYISKNIIFTTKLLPKNIPLPTKWWYYGLEHGQHISFFSKKTLEYIAKISGVKYIYLEDLHIFTEKKNIKCLQLKLIKLNKIGLHKLLSRLFLKPKTWEDYLKLRKK